MESFSQENMDCRTPVPNQDLTLNSSGFENNLTSTRNESRNRHISSQVYPMPMGISVTGIAVSSKELLSSETEYEVVENPIRAES